MKLSELLFINDVIVEHKQCGAKLQVLLYEDREYLQLHSALYIKSDDLSGVSRTMIGKYIF